MGSQHITYITNPLFVSSFQPKLDKLLLFKACIVPESGVYLCVNEHFWNKRNAEEE